MATPPFPDATPIVEVTADVGFKLPPSPPPVEDPEAWDRLDQEKARQIAETDLNSKKKQVRLFPRTTPEPPAY